MTSCVCFLCRLCGSIIFLAALAVASLASPELPAIDAEGNTPLHLAALRNDPDALEALLADGADPNALNGAGATPLHYAIVSERMVAALLARGAKPDVMSKAGITPLLGAAGKPDSFAVARRLIEAGANINAQRRNWVGLLGNASVLALAIANRESRTVELLLERQADLNPPPQAPVPGAQTGPTPLMAAAMVGDIPLARDLLRRGANLNERRGLHGTALNLAFFAGQSEMARFLIEQGADVTLPSMRGYATTPIVWSAYNDSGDPLLTKLLVSRGVDVNTANEAGETALSFALKCGSDTELVRYLRSVGAKSPAMTSQSKALPAREIPLRDEARVELVRDRAQRAVDLLQRASTAFLENGFVRNQAKCVSCHQQALPAVAFGLARERGLRVDEREVGRLLATTIAVRSDEAENARQMDEPTPGRGVTLGYDADALRAFGYASDGMVESFSRYLLAIQGRDGSWAEQARRPPMEDGSIVLTAWTIRAIQLYPPAGREQEIADAMRRARGWLTQQPIRTHNDRVFQLFGLSWAGEDAATLKPLTETLLRQQRDDGGWAQLPGRECDAWATGSALVALHRAGVPATDAGYQRGVEFLLRTQFEDGSWWVRSRTWPFQPHFDGKFPHGKDQWISAAGTAWATIALLHTLKPTVSPASLPQAQQLVADFRRVSGKSDSSADQRAANRAGQDGVMVDFARDIQPLFERSCVGCHGGKRPKGGFTLDSREALLKGGQSGEPAVVPGDAEASPLYRQVRGMVEDLEMPPLSRRVKYPALSGEEIDRLRAWINAGAPWMSAKPEPVSAPRSVFRTLNGVKIHYREWGNPNNPPLVLLHPGFLNSHVWDTFAPAMADRFWVIAPDARGMGESEWSGSYDPDVFLEDLRALIEELGLRRVVLCGNSMGGTMAFMFAGLHPENVQRIITVDTGPGERSTEGAPTPSGASAPKRTGPPPIPSGPFGSVEEAAAQVPKAYGPAFIRAMAEQNLKPCGENRWCWKFDHQGTAGAYERSVRDPRKWPLWRAVKCPTLVLRGERSPALSTQTAEQMIAENKHASLVVIPNAGHFIPLEAPVQFEAEVRKWLGL